MCTEYTVMVYTCVCMHTHLDMQGDDPAQHPKLKDPKHFAAIESGLTFVGMAGIKDPARPEVADAMLLCQQAGMCRCRACVVQLSYATACSAILCNHMLKHKRQYAE